MFLSGKARRFKTDDNINTDYIISGRYKFKIQDPQELAKHVMEDLDPNFFNRIQSGSFAREWVKEVKEGKKNFNALLEKDKNHLIEKVGEELRAMMPWLKK